MVRHVRTAAGVAEFHEPIGSPIVAHPHVAAPRRGAESRFATRASDKRLSGMQTPSQFRHPETGHAMGKSEIGDTFEAIFQAKGARLVTAKYGGPYVAIAGKGNRTTPLDFRLDKRFAGELKTMNANAKRPKTAIKKEEVDRKESAARQGGMQPLLLAQVVDMKTGTVRVYAHPAFASKQVTAMSYVGEYHFTPGDFQRAQQKTGHWDKRYARSAATANVAGGK